MFIDAVKLRLTAGKGGNGVVAWRREKYIPKGGPAGGDGGMGGSVYLEASPHVHSLEDYRHKRILSAESGGQGGSNQCTGRNGKDLFLTVPLGTLVKDPVTHEILFDFTAEGTRWKACQGGKKGLGNVRFKTSTHRAPNIATPGTEGEEREVELELKLIADIGLVGMPNAGKSTLISALSHVAVKIAPYPFTTLRPNLGLIEFEDYTRRLIADIPGIIEDAHQNRGLGHAFLKHIERTSLLLFVIELSPFEPQRDPVAEYEMLRRELSLYKEEMLDKPSIVVLNKIDQEGADELVEAFRSRFPQERCFPLSAKEKIGLEALKEELYALSKEPMSALS